MAMRTTNNNYLAQMENLHVKLEESSLSLLKLEDQWGLFGESPEIKQNKDEKALVTSCSTNSMGTGYWVYEKRMSANFDPIPYPAGENEVPAGEMGIWSAKEAKFMQTRGIAFCVSFVVYDPVTKMGGMAHFLDCNNIELTGHDIHGRFPRHLGLDLEARKVTIQKVP